jgi:hypothetical protein
MATLMGCARVGRWEVLLPGESARVGFYHYSDRKGHEWIRQADFPDKPLEVSDYIAQLYYANGGLRMEDVGVAGVLVERRYYRENGTMNLRQRVVDTGTQKLIEEGFAPDGGLSVRKTFTRVPEELAIKQPLIENRVFDDRWFVRRTPDTKERF